MAGSGVGLGSGVSAEDGAAVGAGPLPSAAQAGGSRDEASSSIKAKDRKRFIKHIVSQRTKPGNEESPAFL